MTVEQLIKELQKMPKKSIVYYQDFDCDTFGISSAPNSVELIDFDEASDEQQKSENDFKLKGKCVVIRS